MPRARNIKPGFFKNEALVELAFEYRLLFQGLWCLADREGRLEDRPKKIKMEIFPADNVDVDKGLSELEKAGFILRYSSKEMKCIQVLNFEKHQNPHHKEKPSTIPKFGADKGKTGSSPGKAPGKPETNPEKVGDDPADSLNPDSLNPENKSPNGDTSSGDDQSQEKTDPEKPNCPHQAIVDLYHKILPELPGVRDLTSARQTQLRARWRGDARFQTLDWWEKYFALVKSSDFLMGRKTDWHADFDFLIRASKFQKIIEGGYQNGSA